MIRGKLHNKRRNLSFHCGVSHYKHAYNRSDYSEQIHSVSYKVGVAHSEVLNYAARNRGENGKFCPARKERNNANGSHPLVFVGKRARVYHCGNGTAEAHNHRHKRTPRKPETAKNSIEHKRYTRHVAAVFQNGKPHKQHKNLRQEAENGEQSAQNAVGNKPRKPFGADCTADRVDNSAEKSVERVKQNHTGRKHRAVVKNPHERFHSVRNIKVVERGKPFS